MLERQCHYQDRERHLEANGDLVLYMHCHTNQLQPVGDYVQSDTALAVPWSCHQP
jgi:hypothetical protein